MKKIIFAVLMMVLGIVVDGMCSPAASFKHHKIKKHHIKSHSSNVGFNNMSDHFRKPPVW